MTKPIKQPKTVGLITYIQSIVIAVLVTLIAGVTVGYFMGVNLQTDARHAAVQDVQAASKANQ